MINTANILAKTYFDTCSIYRMEDVKVGSITHQERVMKYESIPCSLSQGTSKPSGENVIVTSSKYKLFTRPEVDILKGDEIHVVQQGISVAIEYVAGQPFKYHGSHIEVELSRKSYE